MRTAMFGDPDEVLDSKPVCFDPNEQLDGNAVC